jgi:predicted nucleotidyltransferase
MELQIQNAVAELRDRLSSLYGKRFQSTVVFGSRARGDASPDSDVDVLVVLGGDVKPFEEIRRAGDIVADVSLRNDLYLSCIYTSESRFENAETPFLKAVRREGVRI